MLGTQHNRAQIHEFMRGFRSTLLHRLTHFNFVVRFEVLHYFSDIYFSSFSPSKHQVDLSSQCLFCWYLSLSTSGMDIQLFTNTFHRGFRRTGAGNPITEIVWNR